jgi:hypothetical protein
MTASCTTQVSLPAGGHANSLCLLSAHSKTQLSSLQPTAQLTGCHHACLPSQGKGSGRHRTNSRKKIENLRNSRTPGCKNPESPTSNCSIRVGLGVKAPNTPQNFAWLAQASTCLSPLRDTPPHPKPAHVDSHPSLPHHSPFLGSESQTSPFSHQEYIACISPLQMKSP